MAFVRGLWKVLVGIKDALVLLLLLLFFGTLYAVLSATPHGGGPTRGALSLSIDGPIVEQPAEVDPFAFASGGMPREYRLAELVHALGVAAEDPGIEAVALDLDIFAGGRQTALSDIGAAVRRVRAAGKRVLAYATAYDDDTYQIAAQADEVWLNPLGAVVITGPGGANLYYAQLLERLGITAHIYRVGAFKSAVEPYSRSDMSPEARQASQALADTLWSQWREEVGRARPRAQLGAYIAAPGDAVARFNGDMAHAARELGLVDRVGDRSAFRARMAELVGDGDDGLPGSFREIAYDNLLERYPLQVGGGGNIGILTIAGEIIDGEAGPGTAGAETIVRALEEGLRDHDLSALVVRVDSPGGSTLASERIRQAIANVRASGKPVIISMGSVAASGGYWIAAAGDRIFAEPSTITGSIGVFGILPSFEGSLEKLGIGVDGVQTTPLSGQPDILRGPSDEANRFLQMGVEGTYRRFLKLVSDARRLPVERVHEIAQGRVWDGGTARQLGLVDQFGSLGDAITEAARRARIAPDDTRPVFLEPASSWFTRTFGSFARARATISPDPFGRLAQRPQALLRRALDEAGQLLRGSSIQARCLECPAPYDAPPPPRRQASGWWELLLAQALR
ncbi:MAG TPA: signal peptide peptidase SppA [Allosphingosinicella sp.]|jgi:protease-4